MKVQTYSIGKPLLTGATTGITSSAIQTHLPAGGNCHLMTLAG